MDVRDPKNCIPAKVKTIHLIAVCGTAMGALGSLLKDMGYQITGSDLNVYPPMSDFLRLKGIPITEGFDPGNLAYGPDLVVVGNTVSRENVEVVAMQQIGLNFCSLPQAVNHYLVDGRKSLLVAGTHGKTTTSSMLAWVLHAGGLDPSFMIGGILKNFDSNYRLGTGDFVVIEGDEYDTAFFDKGSKFLHYQPYAAILTGVEFDHADIFKDLDHVKGAFEKLVSAMGPEQTLIAWGEDPQGAEVAKKGRCRIVTYGADRHADWRLGRVAIDPPWTLFEVLKGDNLFGSFRFRLQGRHNLLNALAVIATGHHLALGAQAMAAALASFEGVRRRQEVRGIKNGITVMDDFAHHPTAVRETIRAVRPFYPHGRLMAVFEPRTNSSMRNVFQQAYVSAFEQADIVCIRKPSRLHKIPPTERFSSPQLVGDLRRRGQDAYYFEDTEGIIDFVCQQARPGDLVLVMSNGGFDNIHQRVLESL